LALLEYNKSIEYTIDINCMSLLDQEEGDWDLYNICREFGSGYLFAKK